MTDVQRKWTELHRSGAVSVLTDDMKPDCGYGDRPPEDRRQGAPGASSAAATRESEHKNPWAEWPEWAIGGPHWLALHLAAFEGLAGSSPERQALRDAVTAAWERQLDSAPHERLEWRPEAARICRERDIEEHMGTVAAYLGKLFQIRKRHHQARKDGRLGREFKEKV